MIYPFETALEQWKCYEIDDLLGKNGHSRCGRSLIRWALEAGFFPSNIVYSIGSVKYAGYAERHFWGSILADRVRRDETWRGKVIASGIIEAETTAMHEAWLKFVNDDAAVWVMPYGEVVCVKELTVSVLHCSQ